MSSIDACSEIEQVRTGPSGQPTFHAIILLSLGQFGRLEARSNCAWGGKLRLIDIPARPKLPGVDSEICTNLATTTMHLVIVVCARREREMMEIRKML